MNRTERLYALVEDLRARAPRPVTALNLAQRFEVSTRTIERDLLALQEAGVPIWSQPGPGGGYSLHPETTLPPLNLTAIEAASVAIALEAARSMPFADAAHSALQKLTAVMAAPSREGAERLVEQVRIARVARDHRSPAPEAIQRGLLDRLAVAIQYVDRAGHVSERIIEPGGIFSTPNGWYLAAWCKRAGAARAFRLDRIVSAELTAERISPRGIESLLENLPYELAEPALG